MEGIRISFFFLLTAAQPEALEAGLGLWKTLEGELEVATINIRKGEFSVLFDSPVETGLFPSAVIFSDLLPWKTMKNQNCLDIHYLNYRILWTVLLV